MGNNQVLFPLDHPNSEGVSRTNTVLSDSITSTQTSEIGDQIKSSTVDRPSAVGAPKRSISSFSRTSSFSGERINRQRAEYLTHQNLHGQPVNYPALKNASQQPAGYQSHQHITRVSENNLVKGNRGKLEAQLLRPLKMPYAGNGVLLSSNVDRHHSIMGVEGEFQAHFARQDMYGSPIQYSDTSTDGDSSVSDNYKRLVNNDRARSLSLKSSPWIPRSRQTAMPSHGGERADMTYTIALDVNLDYTIHVGKLMLYLKQIRFNLSRVDEMLVEENRLKGKVRCALLSPTKGQRSTSSVFEASKRERRILLVDMSDSFVFYLFPKNQIHTMAISFKVYVCKKLFREFVIGETVLRLGDVNLKAEMLPLTVSIGEANQITIEKRTRSLQPVVLPKSEKLEILLSLQYLPEIAKLVVNVDQTTKLQELRYEAKREIIVQAELVSPSCECVQRKTTFLRISEENPGSNKPFQFELAQEELLLNTLMLSVSYSATRWLQQEKIGWIAFGRNCSGQVEAEHWDLMIAKIPTREAAVQWHCLCESQDVNRSNTLLTRVFK